jgi:alpha-tubulin suppressor-like RCC1 family protein/phosphodiesterase/alkaline phosphatase D-like protein
MRFPQIRRAIVALGAATASLASLVVVSLNVTPAHADAFVFTAVQSTWHRTCALTQDHRAFCWGNNYDGTLGVGTDARDIPTPREVVLPNHELVANISTGYDYSGCAVSTTGNVYCWGTHALGDGRTMRSNLPVAIAAPQGVTFTSVASSYMGSCAITAGTGDLWCWGDMPYNGVGAGPYEYVQTPVQPVVPAGVHFTQISAQSGTMCALDTTGAVWCWGDNSVGQVGIDTRTSQPVLVPTAAHLPQGVQVQYLSSGESHICVVTTTHKAYCWGDNYNYGMLGNHSTDPSGTPVLMQVPNNADVLTVSAGGYHSCILLTSYESYCVGANDGAQGTGVHISGMNFHQSVFPSGVSLRAVSGGLAVTYWIDSQGRLWGSGDGDWNALTGQVPVNTMTTWDPLMLTAFGSPNVSSPTSDVVGGEDATLHASININAASTSVRAQLSDTNSFTTVLADINVGSVSADGSVSAHFVNLDPRTTYWARFVGTNTYGTTSGTAASFTTLGDTPILINSSTISQITGQGASFTSTVNPGNLPTTLTATIADDAGMTSVVTTTPLGSVSGGLPVSVFGTVDNLHARRTYWVQVTATNRLGSITDVPVSFTTIGSPATETIALNNASLTQATFAVAVNPGLLDTSVTLVVSNFADFHDYVASNSAVFRGSSISTAFITVSGLKPHHTYWAQARATNDAGDSQSAPVQFASAGSAPIMSVALRSVYASDSVLIASQVDVSGLDSFVMAQVSTNQDFVEDTSEYYVYVGNAVGSNSIVTELKGLDPHTTYFIRLKGTNEIDTSYSNVITITTPTPVGIEINSGAETTTSTRVNLTVTPPAGAVAVRIADNSNMKNASLFPINGPANFPWTLADAGDPDVPRDVYATFIMRNGQPSGTYWAFIDLVSEPEPVAVTSAALRASASGVHASAVTLKVSGAKAGQKAFIQVRSTKGTVSRSVQASKTGNYTVTLPKGQKVAYLRFVDSKGRATGWIKVKVG